MKKRPLSFLSLAFSLSLVSGCKPQGPTTDVSDHIDDVVQTGLPVGTAPALPTRSEPEDIERQHKQHQQMVEQASREAEHKLEQILENS